MKRVVLAGALAVSLVVEGCAGSATGTSAVSPAGPPAAPTVSEAGSPSPGPSGWQPADDGASIVSVEMVDSRTRDLTIDSPAVGTQKVRLLVPARFDERASARWPVLYLLHGATDSFVSWTKLTDVEALTEPTDLLVAMPDGGAFGWYSDWWNGGRGGRPMWETFHLTELRQLLERNWRASDQRAIAGLSMGGFGAMVYAARHPGMFVAAASFSGALDPLGGQQKVDNALWGNPVAQIDIWKAHDPVYLASDLRDVALYVSYGNGQPGPLDTMTTRPGDLEAWIAAQNETFVARLHELDIPVTVDAYGPGLHLWPYWQRALHNSLPMMLDALGIGSGYAP
jgi:diacylglycerol O-acyltransferase/trehalose O-mycolyltransferase